MNWGKGIAIALTLFIGFIVYLAVVLMSHRVDLEADDYYQQEIVYGEEIQAEKNANKLEHKIRLSAEEEFIVVTLPEEKFENVQVFFSRPNDEKLDKHYQVEGTSTYLIDKKELEKGLYNVDIKYSKEDKDFLQKEKIYIK